MASPDIAWWSRLSSTVRAAGDGDVPVADALRMARDGLHFDCIALFGGQSGASVAQQRVVANVGYPEVVVDYISTTYAMQCSAHRLALDRGTALRFVDLPFDFRSTRTYVEALEPQGFREGVTLPLARSRLGEPRPAFLTMSCTHDQPLGDDARLALTMMAGELHSLTDPAGDHRPSAPPAEIVLRVVDGAVQVRVGDIGDGPLDVPACLRLARLVVTSGPARLRVREGTGRWWWLEARLTRDAVIVRLTPRVVPDGLTARELDVVGLVSRGWSNERIAGVLAVTPRTVRAHVESALAKTRTDNRTALTRLACARDLDTLTAFAASV